MQFFELLIHFKPCDVGLIVLEDRALKFSSADVDHSQVLFTLRVSCFQPGRQASLQSLSVKMLNDMSITLQRQQERWDAVVWQSLREGPQRSNSFLDLVNKLVLRQIVPAHTTPRKHKVSKLLKGQQVCCTGQKRGKSLALRRGHRHFCTWPGGAASGRFLPRTRVPYLHQALERLPWLSRPSPDGVLSRCLGKVRRISAVL